jgi:hypothetical protein
MVSRGRVIDAAVRFLRNNPELVAFAQAAAPVTGRSVEELLADAVERFRSSAQAVPQEQMITRSAS